MATFGILVGGGPAPGINGVIAAATILARRSGARVIGLVDGFSWLMQEDTSHCFELRIAQVSRIHLLGGSILQTSRANPTKQPGDLERVVASLEKLGIDHLITIGGDDTAYSARRVSEQAAGRIRVAHVPKTIDNDLPLPGGIPTFGFETAREHATRIVSHLMEDARTSQRWFFVVMMGRTAGHLALGAAKAAGATLALIPEEFPGGAVRLETLTRILEGAIVKRLSMHRGHGVAVIAEGVGARLEPKDLEALSSAPRDEHGHVRLAEVPLGAVLRDEVRASLSELGIKMTIVEKDVGYELRCAEPTAFDLDYTRDLGAGAVRTLLGGTSGVLITRQNAEIVPIPFDELMDPKTHKTRVRLVDVETESHGSARSLQVRVEPDDFADAERLERIAEAAKLTPEQARERWAGAAIGLSG
jgi:6-phosphofructokinase 1